MCITVFSKALFDGIHENAASVHSALKKPKQLEQCLQGNSAAANQLETRNASNCSCTRAAIRAVDATGQTAVQLARP